MENADQLEEIKKELAAVKKNSTITKYLSNVKYCPMQKLINTW